MAECITRCLSSLVGKSTAMTLNFRLDPYLAASDPDTYAARLAGLTGQLPSSVILKRIEDLLCERVGLPKREWTSLAECVTITRKTWNPDVYFDSGILGNND